MLFQLSRLCYRFAQKYLKTPLPPLVVKNLVQQLACSQTLYFPFRGRRTRFKK